MISYSFYERDTRILQYTHALRDRGDSVDVIALRDKGLPIAEMLDGVNVSRIQGRSVNERGRLVYLLRMLRFLIASAFVLSKRQLTDPYDVIHVHSVPDFLVFSALIPKLLGAKVILDIHDILPEFYSSKFNLSEESLLFKLLLLTERLSARAADHVIVANELWQSKLSARAIPAPKCTAIRNYPDPNIFYPRKGIRREGKFTILYPGTLNHHQGLDIAVRAFARAAAAMPDAELWIYGEGPDKDALKSLRDSLDLRGRVHIEDSLPLREISSVMASSDLAVVPKRVTSPFGNEAASTKIMEFMSVGVPVIVSRTKIDSFYHDESMVRFFEPQNEEELAEAMLQLRRSDELRQQLAENATRYVQENNWEQKKIDYLDLIDSLGTRCQERASTKAHA